MVHDERTVHILYAMWMFDCRKKKDPDLEKKYAFVKEILGRIGIDNGEKFDAVYERFCRRDDELNARGNYLEPCDD
ncbi:MAG: hypothetical protein J6K32_04590 [Clostridia bacterium]|nr:hypothetical protein [Clostridia bacterium]